MAAATQFVTLIGFGLSMPFIPLYVQALGIHDRAEIAIWSGVLAGSAALSMAFMAPLWGALADRYGRKAMLVRSMLWRSRRARWCRMAGPAMLVSRAL